MRKGSYSEELVKVDLYVEIHRCDMLHADEMLHCYTVNHHLCRAD